MASQSELLFHHLLRDFGRPAPTDRARRQLLDSLAQRKLLTNGTSALVLLAPPEFVAELVVRGASVTTVEPLEDLLEQARRRLTGMTATVHWVRRDPHRLPFRRAFDLILGMGLVLGTSGNEAEDQEFLRSLASALRPGGTLVLDLPNRELLVREFVERFWAELDGLRVLVRQNWDVPTGIVQLEWH
ncbi:MAG: class I SAM-dependent methyltransferase, partial [Thermomicrobium sp.]